ncbi:hypothetical protein ACFST9_08470 [Hymenobacter monticola]|uniref:DUF4401 domain-containing protein n=1 Tax=Hymenobacter monticola TaxID=1705399 RepID=A0ABY4B9A1_9BACT|nr:hypothetical protein [Hymenobacter monticola]UOE35752.1 hypothetical protein MTP16_08920 [Hymenobacter monticola]
MKIRAYNPDWAFNSALRKRAARWQRQQLANSEQLAAIEALYPLEYYRPVWPLRVGLFIFSCLGVALGGSFLLLMTGSHTPFASGLVFCVACFALLELLIKEQRCYHAGVDNALLYAGLSSASGLIYYAFSEYLWPQRGGYHLDLGATYLVVLLVLALLVAATLRYADAVVTAAAVAAALLLVALFGLNSPKGQMLLPFLLMGAAGGLLLLYRKLAQHAANLYLTDYYANCLLTLKVLSLAVLYLAGNYLVVREGSAELHHEFTSTQIPFAPVFYALTAGVPLLYIVLGLRRADRPLLLLGLLALAFSLFTLRHYRSLLPPEVAAVAAGTLLTVLAGALLRFLRPARGGLTSMPDDEPRHFNLENLIQAQTAHAPDAPATGGFEFGGGHSGGGGATGQF